MSELSIKKDRPYFRPFFYNEKENIYNSDNEITGLRTIIKTQFPDRIVVIGCGGNGGYFIPLLARFISQHQSDLIKNIPIIIMDGDRVEEKNIFRQNFIPSDIGKFKSEVIAERCNRAFGMNIIPVALYYECGHGIYHNDLVIGCVDNDHVRKSILKNSFQFYVDVGNELDFGQVFLNGPVKNNGYCRMDYIYDNVKNADEYNTRPSCADNTASGEQRMDTNVMAATVLFNVVCSLFSPKPIYYYEIAFNKYGMRPIYFDNLELGFLSDYWVKKKVVEPIKETTVEEIKETEQTRKTEREVIAERINELCDVLTTEAKENLLNYNGWAGMNKEEIDKKILEYRTQIINAQTPF